MTFAFLLFLAGAIPQTKVGPTMDTILLKKQIAAQTALHPEATFAIAFYNPSNGEELLLNAHQPFHAASTIKMAFLIETFKQAAAGKLALTDSILIKNNFKSIADGSPFSVDSADDSEKDLYLQIGKKQTVADLLYLMITESSNLATNLIVELVGAKHAAQTIHKLGAKDMQVLRGVEDQKAFDLGMNNKTTAYDLMVIFKHLAMGTAVDKQACDQMIRILMAQHFREMIPAKLPGNVKTATKSGWINGICHDAGIIFLPDGRRYVLVLLSQGIQDPEVAHETLATISKLVYDQVVKN
jgi:beta-lactamase class A